MDNPWTCLATASFRARRSAPGGTHNNRFCAALQAITESAGLLVDRKAEVRGRERPADLLISHWSQGHDAAIDPTVVHGLNPSHPWDLHHAAVDKAEEVKHLKSDAPCAEADIAFVPWLPTPSAPMVVKVSVSWGSCSPGTQSGDPVAAKRDILANSRRNAGREWR